MKAALALLGVIAGSGSALAVEAPRPIGDLGRAISSEGGSGPHGFARIGDRVVFAAQPDDLADRLFVTDGTEPGTRELRAICPPRVEGRVTLHHGGSDRAYFHAACGDGARQLWVTDGTADGTLLLTSSPIQGIHDEGTSGWAPWGLRGWFEAGESTYFLWKGEDGTFELWSTRGAPSTTHRVWKPSGSEGELFGGLGRSDGSAVLVTGRVLNSLSFWFTDGTDAGTSLLRTIPSAFGGLSFTLFGELGPRLFAWVPGEDPSRTELWASDGTQAGTVRLAELAAHQESVVFPTDGDALYFVARSNGVRSIWRSAGTSDSTGPIVNLTGWSTTTRELVVQGDRLLFLLCGSNPGAGCALARAPTAGGAPEAFLEECGGASCGAIDRFSGLRTVGDRTLFWIRDADGPLLVATDGLDPRAEVLARSAGAGTAVEGEIVFLRSPDDGRSCELWMSDGTAAGTIRLGHGLSPDLLPNHGLLPVRVSESRWVVPLRAPETGRELWTMRREADSLSPLADLRADRPGLLAADRASRDGSPLIVAVQNDRWRTEIVAVDAPGSRVERLFEVPPADPNDSTPAIRRFRQFVSGDEWLFFERAPRDLAWPSTGARQIYRYRPDSGEVSELFSDPAGSGVGSLGEDLVEAAVGPLFLGSVHRPGGLPSLGEYAAIYRWNAETRAPEPFEVLPATSAYSPGVNRGIWYLVEDGRRLVGVDVRTLERRVLVEREEPFDVTLLALEHGVALLLFPHWESSVELWRSDGTIAGTTFLDRHDLTSSMFCSDYFDYSAPVEGRSSLLAFGNTCGGATLWISDGSRERTRKLRQAGWNLTVGGSAYFRGEQYFFVRDRGPVPAPTSHSLWRTNGTPEGTVHAVELPVPPDPYDPSLQQLASGERALYFRWTDAEHGAEPWRSDGAPGGTRLAADLEPGPASSNPHGFVTLRDQVLFAATTAARGTELWQADGEEEAPEIVADLYPGPESSSPTLVTAEGERLVYLADDGVAGRELWEVTEPSTASCEPSATTLCLAGGRFRARAVSRDFAGRSGAAKAETLAAESGYFWFFEPGNPELLVKVVDACAVPGVENFWTYASGLTNLEVELELVDTASGERSAIRRPLGEPFGPRFETGAFFTCDLGAGASTGAAVRSESEPGATPSVLSLLGARFEATVDWATADGSSGRATAVPMSDGSGYFWFFHPALAEVVVKMADACGLPAYESYWLFAAGLTDVSTRLIVRDLATGEFVVGESAAGIPFPSLLETGRFRSCGQVGVGR